MADELVSIIIPLYNAEQYVDKILPCIMGQTYSALEILLVNDGSTDSTLEKCKAYQQKDGRIRILTQENGGVSTARNRGLAEATGAYVSFVDADDYLKSDFIEVLYRSATAEDCDVVCSDCIETMGSYELTPLTALKSPRPERVVEDYREVLQDYCENTDMYGAVACMKLWKRTLAQSEQFDRRLHYGEDTLYVQRVLRHAKRIKLLGYRGYYYIRWDLSATKQKSINDYGRLADYAALAKEMVQISADTQDEALIRIFRERYACAIVTLARSTITMDGEKRREVRHRIMQPLQEEGLISVLPFAKRVELFLYRYCGPLYRASMKRHLARYN